MRISDLAVEFSKKLVAKKDYTKTVEKINKNITKTTIEIITDKAQTKFDRQKGFYTSLDIPFDPILQSLEKQNIEVEISKALSSTIKKCELEKLKSVLVVGLGNPKMISDCFGAKVSEKVMVTRHLSQSVKDGSLCEVSSLSTNVFGLTGLESYDIIKGVVDRIRPDLVIVIDTLVAESSKRLCTNIQIANVGIVPGSGVDNARKEISRNTLSTPVITIGIPFVVFASSLFDEQVKKLIRKYSGVNLPISIEAKGLNELVVMPKEIDEQVRFSSKVVASGINMALNPNFSPKDIETFFI